MRVNKTTNEIKIVDFGIAGLFAGKKSEVTRAGSLLYMAPEVLSRKNMIASPGMDIWSVGCILYALVVGNLPFQDKNDDKLIKKIIEGEIQYPKGIKLSPEVSDLIENMLHKNPEKRIKMSDIKNHPWFNNKKL